MSWTVRQVEEERDKLFVDIRQSQGELERLQVALGTVQSRVIHQEALIEAKCSDLEVTNRKVTTITS